MGPKKQAVNFAVGDKVFAKVRGYPAWPARIEECMDAKGGPKYKVFFYGTYESATMKKDELWLFSDETKTKYGEIITKYRICKCFASKILSRSLNCRQSNEAKELPRGHARD